MTICITFFAASNKKRAIGPAKGELTVPDSFFELLPRKEHGIDTIGLHEDPFDSEQVLHAVLRHDPIGGKNRNPFQAGSFDLLRAEGSVYNIGVKKGLPL